MARLLVVSLLLTLVMAPVASATTERAEPVLVAWQNLFLRSMEQVFSWMPTPGLILPKAGVYIIPNGGTAPPPAGAGGVHEGSNLIRPLHGACIVPNGLLGGGSGPDRPDGAAPPSGAGH